MINFHSVAHKLNRVTILKAIVMDVKSATTGRYRTTSKFGYGNSSAQDVVVDLYILIAFKRHFDREPCFDRVMMNMATPTFSSFYSIIVFVRRGFCDQKSIIPDLRIGHPNGENSTTSDASFDSWFAIFPSLPRVNKCAVVDFYLLHAVGANATVHKIFNP